MEGIFESWSNNKRKGVEVEFYGTIYNRDIIGGEGLTDRQLVKQLYVSKGYESFQLIDGAFVAVIRDDTTTIIVRDRHGMGSQLFYNERCYAGSLEMIRQKDLNSRSANRDALVEFMMRGYIATGRSSLQGVSKLGAGDVLIYKGGKIEILKPQQDVGANIDALRVKSIEEATQYYKELHQNAIKRRIGGHNSVGLLLSGGYDSGSNLSALREVYSGELSSFTVGFKGDRWSEMPLARLLSDHFGTTHYEYEIDGSEIKHLPSIVKSIGDPFIEGGLMVNYAAMKMVFQNRVDVVVGGDGSDQYFGTSAREIALHHILAKGAALPLAKGAFNLLSNSWIDNNDLLYKVRFHLDKVLNILEGDIFGFQPYQLEKMIIDGFTNPMSRTKEDNSSFDALFEQHRLKSDIDKIINQVIIFKASKMAEMFGNNIVFPFMDAELYHLINVLPRGYKSRIDGGLFDAAKGRVESKHLLKRAYKESLPREITERKKQGGFAPMPIFFNDPKRRANIKEFIISSPICGELLDKRALVDFIENFEKSYGDSNRWFWYHQNVAIQYFNLLTLAVWWEIFVEGKELTRLDI